MEEVDVEPSPIRGPAYMYRCPVCQGLGKTGTTLGFGGSSCGLCQGRCYLQREPTPCPCCDAKGGFATMFGLKWNTCRLCHGIKYLMERPFPCPKCSATGLVKSLYGVLRTPCDLCDRQRYLKQPHGRCIKCNFSSSIAKYFRKCINCSGIGYSQEPQHLCPRCNSTGYCRGHNCVVCGGNGVIHHEVVSCAKCNGAGEIRRPLHLLMGSSSCPTCNGQGYFQVFTSGSTMPVPPKTARKRQRKSDAPGKSTGNASVHTRATTVPRLEEGEKVDGDDFWMALDGMEEDIESGRRVRPRPTPQPKEGRRRANLMLPPSSVSTLAPSVSRAKSGSSAGWTPGGEAPLSERFGDGGVLAAPAIGGVDNDEAVVFSPGVGPSSETGKRRRAR